MTKKYLARADENPCEVECQRSNSRTRILSFHSIRPCVKVLLTLGEISIPLAQIIYCPCEVQIHCHLRRSAWSQNVLTKEAANVENAQNWRENHFREKNAIYGWQQIISIGTKGVEKRGDEFCQYRRIEPSEQCNLLVYRSLPRALAGMMLECIIHQLYDVGNAKIETSNTGREKDNVDRPSSIDHKATKRNQANRNKQSKDTL